MIRTELLHQLCLYEQCSHSTLLCSLPENLSKNHELINCILTQISDYYPPIALKAGYYKFSN